MKTEEAKLKVAQILIKKKAVTVKELNESTQVPNLQLYSILSNLVKSGAVKLDELDGKKSYSLIDAGKLGGEQSETPDAKAGKKQTGKVLEVEPVVEKIDSKTKKKSSRDLTIYHFNGTEYNKGRLALAIITQYAKDKKPSFKTALQMFPDEIVKPYGVIRSVKEAKEASKIRPRFFLGEDNEVKLRDGNICVSNQFTKERIDQIIVIAKTLGYKIKEK
jgi:hypothetical protein